MINVIGRGSRRAFVITCGTQEGYGPTGKTHTVQAVETACQDWMAERAASGQPFITGSVTTGTVVYAWPEGEGKAGRGSETVALFSGVVSTLYNAAMSNEQVSDLLTDLAGFLAERFGQTRVYVEYIDETWVVERSEGSTPTGN